MPLTSSTPTQPALPTPRSVPPGRILTWLGQGWRDLVACGPVSLLHGLMLAFGGTIIMVIAHEHFWLLAGAASGFLVVAPVLATSLYALSRALERGEPVGFSVVAKTWLNWQNDRIDKWGDDYWCMVRFGVLLGLAGTGWVLTSAALITLLAPGPVATPEDFIRHVILADHGWLFEIWLAAGGLMAAPIFASSIVAMPLLLDRRVTLRQAVLASWQVVLTNPLPCAIWATTIAGLTLLGMATLMLGLIVIVPWLGHASWHAYRDLIDTDGFAQRAPPQ